MKNNLENAFRNSLKDYEVPYDPKAWEAVSAKLGASSAVGTSIMSSAMKWALAGIVLVTVVTGAIFFWGDQNEAVTAELNNTPTEERLTQGATKNNITPNSDRKSEKEAIVSPLEKDDSKDQAKNTNEKAVKQNARQNSVAQSNTDPKKADPKKADAKTNIVSQGDPTPGTPKSNEVNAEKFVAGHISNPIVCEGQSVVIKNQDKNGKVKFQINGKWIVLQPGKSYVVNPKTSMEVDFVNDRGEVIEIAFITTHNMPSANFTFESNVYEEGLPVVVCQAYGDYASYHWTFDNKLVRNGVEVKHHFYDKGDYEVDLKVIDRNGCEHTTTKTVRINDKYNLMAVDAFKPNGSDSRNSTFMPYSLTERDVKFLLTIVDPLDNSVVFTSSDANNAWDGMDQKSGRMTPSNKAYIWKVQIFNPLPNERPIYAGTIVHN